MLKRTSTRIASERAWWRVTAAQHGTTPRALIASTYEKERSLRKTAAALGVSMGGLRAGMKLYDVMPRQHGGARRGRVRQRILGDLDVETLFLTPARVLADKYRITTQLVYKERGRRGKVFDAEKG